MRTASTMVCAVATALALAACGDRSASPSTAATATTAATTAPRTARDPATTAGVATTATAATTATTTKGAGATASASKPTIEVPSTPPPATLQIEDITVGTGAEATTGKKVSVQYVGVSYSTKKEFDASWDRGQPFTFDLGGGGVIKGWDQGVPGMKVGGRRKLTIPPDLGYGQRGAGADVKPGETLVFVVDLVEVKG